MKKIIIAVVSVIVLASVAVGVLNMSRPAPVSGPMVGSAQNTDILTRVSETSVKLSSPSSTLLAANADRRYARCFNRESAGNGAWVSFGATASVGGGLYLTASSSFTITGDNLYTGIVTARNRLGTETGGTTASASVRVTCQELSL